MAALSDSSLARAALSCATLASARASAVSYSLLAMSWLHVHAYRLRLVFCEGGARAHDLRSRALDLGFLIENRGAGGVEVGLSLNHSRLEDLGIDLRNHLAFVDD